MNNRQFKKYLLEGLAGVHANILHEGKTADNWFQFGNIEFNLDPDTNIWDLDIGSLDILKDNPHAQAWFAKKYKGKTWADIPKHRKVNVALEYTDELLEHVPQGTTIALKGSAIRTQGGAKGSAKNKRYIQRWGHKHGFFVLPDNAGLLFQKDITKRPLKSESYPGVTSEYDYQLAKEDWKIRKALSPDKYIDNVYTVGGSEPFLIERRGRGDELKGKAVSLDIDKSAKRRALRRSLPQETDQAKRDLMKTRAAEATLEGKDVDHIRAMSLYDEGKGIGHIEENLQKLDQPTHQFKTAEERRLGRSMASAELRNPSKSLDFDATLRAIGKHGIYKNLSGADAALNIGGGLATGNVGAVAGGAVGLSLQNPAVQKYLAKRLARMGGKLAPGVGIGLSGLEAAGYASQGRIAQAGIATASGLVGEVPLVGDLVSAGLDLTNTGIDLFTGNFGSGVDDDDIYRHIGRKPRF